MIFRQLPIGGVFLTEARGSDPFIKISDTDGIKLTFREQEAVLTGGFYPERKIVACRFISQRTDDIPEYGNRLELTYLEDESCECSNEPDQATLIDGSTSQLVGEPSLDIGDMKFTVTNWDPIIIRTSKLSDLKVGDIFSFEASEKDPYVLLEGIGGEFNFLRLNDGVKLVALNWMWDSITVYVIRNGVKNEI